jgi:amino acid adenylation domain-containing protein
MDTASYCCGHAWDRCVHQLFEEQTQRSPDAVAVEFEGRRLTYAQLNAWANQLAHHLITLGVRPEARIGLCTERSLEMVVGVIGILKAGAAYLPIAPSLPAERVTFVCRDAGVSYMLTYGDVQDRLQEVDAPLFRLETDLSHLPTATPSIDVSSRCAAYILYTSGSTGRPKGVVMEHAALVNLVCWHQSVLPGPARTLQFTSIGFDVSFQELFTTWWGGGTLILVGEETRQDLARLLTLIEAERIDRLFVPFAVLQHLARAGVAAGRWPAGLQEVITAGEALRITDEIAAWFGQPGGPRLYNQYGPTEAHVVSSFRLEGQAPTWSPLPPIGRPIANVELYVLDAQGCPAPVGTAGELSIGGRCLARGYLNRVDLTAERFVPNRFSAVPGSRLYRTGDQVRYLADGNLEFLGRTDHQVKIRGNRVELGEIESALRQQGDVGEVVVSAREEEPGNQRLVAYVVTKNAATHPDELRKHLRRTLPEYMIPSAFVMLDALPLTPNGKIDRLNLPAPQFGSGDDEAGYAEAHTGVEAILLGLWSQCLGVKAIGIHDSFFDLGGHSLSAALLIAQIRSAFGRELPLSALFEAPTIAQLSRRLLSATEAVASLLVSASRDRSIPLAFAQEALWYSDILAPGRPVFTIPVLVRMTGSLNVAALEASLTELVRRHEALRTTFTLQGTQPVQTIHPPQRLPLTRMDLTMGSAPEREIRFKQALEAEVERPFDLTVAPLFRAYLWRLSEDEHRLLFTMHHAIADGRSLQILQREVSALYRAHCCGDEPSLPPLTLQYADYSIWQRQWLEDESLAAQTVYWCNRLADLPTLRLATDRPRPGDPTFCGAVYADLLAPTLVARLKDLSRREGVTLFMSLLAAFNVLLARYSDCEDIVVGSVISKREQAELEPLIGLFVNTLVLRTDLSGKPTFRELLSRVRRVALEAYAHSDLPFEKLVQAVNPERSRSRHPLFQVMIVMENPPAMGWRLPDLQVEEEILSTNTAKLDLLLSLTETEGGLACSWEYSTDLFDASTIERLHGHLRALLEAAVSFPDQVISRLSMLRAGERHRLLLGWNDTATDRPETGSLHGCFEKQAHRAPDAVALLFRDECVTYGQLNVRANRLARALHRNGVRRGDVVGLCIERSFETIIGLLAILKAGAAYLPLNPSDPSERLHTLLREGRPRLLLCDTHALSLVQDFPCPHLHLPRSGDLGRAEEDGDLALDTGAEDLAYLMFTSGSTGHPRGVAVPHRAVLRLVLSPNYCRLGPDEVMLQFAPLTFDASTFEIWGSLLNGARLVLFDGQMPDLQQLGTTIQEHGVTTLWLTAGLFHAMVDANLPSLLGVRQLLAGGDVVSPSHVAQALRGLPGCRVINGYGPTENTTFTCCHAVSANEEIGAIVPIGRPIGNTQVYVLDRNLEPVPIGAVGELYAGGDGLAWGYLQRTDLTAEKFVPDPFSGAAGARLYRTGDRVRRRSDGLLEFLGRLDDQVKIRGFRIALGEVESALRDCSEVREAVVLAREDEPGDRRLVGYVVADDGPDPVSPSVLRERLLKRLPGYLVPSAFVLLDSLPLTPNGKIDRKALPVPGEEDFARNHAYAAPRNAREELLASLWRETLGVERVGIYDSFFDLGGHSLLAMQLILRIEQAIGSRLPLSALLQAPTIASLGQRLQERRFSPNAVGSLVVIQPQGERTPLFCVHSIGGHVLEYRLLAKYLAANQPVYGFDALGFDGVRSPRTSVEEMATAYLGEMRAVQPEGPYFLCGRSSGGSIAFEMALQLAEQGERVGLLAMMDTHLPGGVSGSAGGFKASLFEAMDRHLGILIYQHNLHIMPYVKQKLGDTVRQTLGQPLIYLNARLDAVFGRSTRGAAAPVEDRLSEAVQRVVEANRRAYYCYVPRYYAGRVTQFLARHEARTGIDARLLWPDLVRDGLELHLVDGDHATMLEEPHVRGLAAKLQACLDRADERAGSAQPSGILTDSLPTALRRMEARPGSSPVRSGVADIDAD